MQHISLNFGPIILLFTSLISLFGCYTAVHLFQTMREENQLPKKHLKWFSSILLGLTIWSIQYISMFNINHQIHYYVGYLLLGFFLAVAGSYYSLHVFQRVRNRQIAIVGGALLLTGTMKTVHLIAVYSFVDIQTEIRWNWVVASIIITLLFSLLGYFIMEKSPDSRIYSTNGSYLLGVAVLSMNYLCLSSEILYYNDKFIPRTGMAIMEREAFYIVTVATSILIITGFIIQYRSKQKTRMANDIKQIRLHSLFNQNPYAIYSLDHKGRVTNCNDAAVNITGYTLADLHNKSYRAFVAKDYHKQTLKYFFSTINGNTEEFETKIISASNEALTVRVKSFPIIYHSKIMGVYTIIQDITENVQLKFQLSEKATHYRLISEFSKDLIMLINENAKSEFVSPSYTKSLGYSVNELLHINPFTYMHPDDLSDTLRVFEEVKETNQPAYVKSRYLMKNGEYLPLESSVVPIKENDVQYYLVTSRDITERVRLEGKLKDLAYNDSLTKIPNRGYFNSKLEETIQYFINKPPNEGGFSVLILDFDRFKWVNDTFGHDCGDQLLIEFVERVKQAIDSREFFARLGGDEFAIILPCNNEVYIEERANTLLKTLQVPWSIFQHEFITTSSIGIARYPMDGINAKEILAYADQALYNAKSKGRNTFSFYTNIIAEKYSRRTSIENGLRVAIEKNHFYLVYQPQIHLQTNQIVGVEVLLRYLHPQLGLISPVEFIPLCENSGMIDDVTQWVLRKALTQQNRWVHDGLPRFKMAINISPSTIANSGFADIVHQCIMEMQVSSEYIELEITEDVFFEYSRQTLQTLQELTDLGIKISLDDFGSGYSSLRQMKELPLDKIKIDKVFMDHLDSERDRAFLDSILDLTKKLNSVVVCEGIETSDQVDYLKSKGEIIAQGYFFSKPLKSFEFERWLANQSESLLTYKS